MIKNRKRGYQIHFYNPTFAKTGFITYTTISEERAIELFYKDYDKTYIIMGIIEG